MEKLWKVVFAGLLALSLAACGSPKLDTSSPEALQKSTQKILDDLPAEKQAKFTQAMGTIVVSAGLKNLKEGKSSAEVQEEVMKKLDGKTADEVIAMAEELAK